MLTVGVLCAHLGVLWLVSHPGRPGSAGGRPGVVTIAPGKTASAPRPAAVLDADTAATEPRPGAAATESAADPALPPPDPAPAPAPAPAALPAAATASASAPQAPAPSGDGGGDEFLPRSALTVAPRVRSEVRLDYPTAAPLGRFRGRVTLFVDETGSVRRMRFETPDAEFPAVFQDEVRQRFSAATISPGEVDGRPVKAQHVIVVDFDAGVGEDESSRPAR